MILTPAVPSDRNPQVRVSSTNSNVMLTFWKGAESKPDLVGLESELEWLHRNSTWRASATHGVMRTRLESCGLGTGRSWNGYHFYMSVLRRGCTNNEFEVMFKRFAQQVLKIAAN